MHRQLIKQTSEQLINLIESAPFNDEQARQDAIEDVATAYQRAASALKDDEQRANCA